MKDTLASLYHALIMKYDTIIVLLGRPNIFEIDYGVYWDEIVIAIEKPLRESISSAFA